MKKMNQVPVIVRNPVYVEDLEPERDGVYPADPAPYTSRDDPMVTAPDTDDEEDPKRVLQEAVQSLSRLNDGLRSVLALGRDQRAEVSDVDVYDTRRVIEEECRLFPDPTRKELKDRMDNQVLVLLRLLHERVVQGSYNETDIKLIEGIQLVSLLHARLSVYTELAIRHGAEIP